MAGEAFSQERFPGFYIQGVQVRDRLSQTSVGLERHIPDAIFAAT
jgi:hypothetical protein